MQNILDFFLFFFLIMLINFFFNFNNFIFLFFYSEFCWVILYNYSIILGLFSDNYLLISNSFFILCFSTIEFSICFILLLVFKENSIYLNFTFLNDLNILKKIEKNSIFLKNYFWIK